MKARFLDFDSESCRDLDLTRLRAVLPALELYDATSPAEVAERVRDAEAVLLDQCPLPRRVLESARRLRLIALTATGYDNVDLAAARERGIAVCNVRDYCTQSLMQHTWALILSLTQRLAEYRALATGGAWVCGKPINVAAHGIRELSGRTLGIVGWGTLGRAVARTGECFGMQVLIAGRPAAPTPAVATTSAAGEFDAAPAGDRVALGELLSRADIVSLHCPLTPETRGLIGAAELARMKPDALLINTARGGLVDSAALAAALRAGRIGGAGIDVLPQEPPVAGDPLLDPALPRIVVTPHVAWAAREARQRILDEVAANVRDFLDGGRRGRVD